MSNPKAHRTKIDMSMSADSYAASVRSVRTAANAIYLPSATQVTIDIDEVGCHDSR
jgi:hypothetical protein